MNIKVSNWGMDAQNDNQATLFIKDTDDNPTVSRIMATPQPITEIKCINNNVETRTFHMCGITQVMPDSMDGDFMVHPVKIVFESWT